MNFRPFNYAGLKRVGNFYFDVKKLESVYYNPETEELNVCIHRVINVFKGKGAEEMFNQFKEILENDH